MFDESIRIDFSKVDSENKIGQKLIETGKEWEEYFNEEPDCDVNIVYGSSLIDCSTYGEFSLSDASFNWVKMVKKIAY